MSGGIGSGIKFPSGLTVIPRTDESALPAGTDAPASGLKFEKIAGSAREVPALKLFMQTAAALGLPADKLSVNLLTFARLFSLPLDKALIAVLRREVLASSGKEKATHNPVSTTPSMETKALGAAAAFDKGVTLSPEALERYARFLGDEGHGEPAFGGGGESANSGGKRDPPDREEVPQEEELRVIAEKEAKDDGLLDLLNTLPGKNGHYWVVYPLKIRVKGTELSIFIRLLKGEAFSSGENEFLNVDVIGPRRQYRCFLKEKAGSRRADIRVYPELNAKALKALTKKAERFLGDGAVLVQNGGEQPSWVEDLCFQPLPSVNEEV